MWNVLTSAVKEFSLALADDSATEDHTADVPEDDIPTSWNPVAATRLEQLNAPLSSSEESPEPANPELDEKIWMTKRAQEEARILRMRNQQLEDEIKMLKERLKAVEDELSVLLEKKSFLEEQSEELARMREENVILKSSVAKLIQSRIQEQEEVS